MKKVLILGVASVQMDAILELIRMGIETFACARENDGPGSEAVDHFELLDFIEQDKVMSFIREKKIDCIYSVGSDIAMPVCSEISEKLHLPYFVTSETAKICNNKKKMRECLGNDFKGNIRFQALENCDTEIMLDYPFIIKPSDSQGQRGVHIAHNYEELKRYFDICKGFSRSGIVMLEEYIEGFEVSLNAYVVDGKICFLVVSDRITWSEFQGGLVHKHIVPSRFSNWRVKESLKDLAERTIQKLGILNGPVYFQIKVRNNQPYIIEVTPRLDGCHLWKVLKYYTGVNVLKLTFEHLIFKDVGELKNYMDTDRDYVLEFLCDAPRKKADYTQFEIPSDAVCNFKYYNDGDVVRPINGYMEKIGYFITQNQR